MDTELTSKEIHVKEHDLLKDRIDLLDKELALTKETVKELLDLVGKLQTHMFHLQDKPVDQEDDW